MSGLKIRASAVAGSFYPERKEELVQLVKSYLDNAYVEVNTKPKAMIVPHAGYMYSGPVAAHAYKALLPYREEYEKILILGPSHFAYISGIAYHSAEFFETPLGMLKVHKETIAAIQHLPYVFENDRAHAKEHSLEVQLPFLQYIFGNMISVIPLTFGKISPHELMKVFSIIYDDRTLILVSSDLSHYHDYATARVIDEQTAKAIEEQTPEAIHEDQACGRKGIQAILLFAKQQGWKTLRLDLRNSGDISGRKHRVVGYGAWVFI